MQENVITVIRSELKQQVDEKTRDTAQSFFKENVTVYGVRTPLVNKIAGEY